MRFKIYVFNDVAENVMEFDVHHDYYFDSVRGEYTAEDKEFFEAVNEFREDFGLEKNGNPTINKEEMCKIVEYINKKLVKTLEYIKEKSEMLIKYNKIDKYVISDLYSMSTALNPKDFTDLYCTDDYHIINIYELAERFSESQEEDEVVITKIYDLHA